MVTGIQGNKYCWGDGEGCRSSSCDTFPSRAVGAFLKGQGLQVLALKKLKLAENREKTLIYSWIHYPEWTLLSAVLFPGSVAPAGKSYQDLKDDLKGLLVHNQECDRFLHTLMHPECGITVELLMLVNCNISAHHSGLTHCIPGVSKNSKAIIFLFGTTTCWWEAAHALNLKFPFPPPQKNPNHSLTFIAGTSCRGLSFILRQWCHFFQAHSSSCRGREGGGGCGG